MEEKTGLICVGNPESKVSVFVKTKKALYKTLRYLMLGIGIVIIGAVAVPTVILVMIIKELWSLIDHILSSLDERIKA